VPEAILVALPIVLPPAFIPLFADLRLKLGDAVAWRFGQRTAGALLLLLLGVAALVAWCAPLYLPWLAPGFSPLARQQAAQAVVIMSPAIALMGAAALVAAILHVYRRFGLPALSTATYNAVFAAFLLAAPLILGPVIRRLAPTATTFDFRAIRPPVWSTDWAAWGVTLGAIAALAIQMPLLRRYRPTLTAKATISSQKGNLSGRGRQRPAGVRDVARLAAPLAVAYAVHHAIRFVDRAMATTLEPGSVAALNYAYRLALVVGQLSGLAVSTALFPRMAEQAASGDTLGLRSSLAFALRFVWRLGLPASVGLIALRQPLVQLLFERGAFGPKATAAVSGALLWYALAVFADALCQPLWRILYAQQNSGVVLAVNSLQTAIRIVGNVALVGTFGYNGLALSAACGLSAQLLVLGWLVRRRLGTFLDAEWWRAAAWAAAATAAGLLVTMLISDQLIGAPSGLLLAMGGGLGGATYLLILGWSERHAR
jgi:putative peptidoglycan lipid II flippase